MAHIWRYTALICVISIWQKPPDPDTSKRSTAHYKYDAKMQTSRLITVGMAVAAANTRREFSYSIGKMAHHFLQLPPRYAVKAFKAAQRSTR